MFKIFKIVFTMFLIFFSFSGIAFADEVTFNDLIENGKTFDKKNVVVRGEAIGESMKRGSYSWININDGTYPFGIWMKNEDGEKVKVFGDYHHKGDVIKVTGRFNRACSQHGGDMDIHADSVTVEESGRIVLHSLNHRRQLFAVGLTLLTVILGALTYRKIKRHAVV